MVKLVNSEGWLNHIGDRTISTIAQSKAFITSTLNSNSHFYHVFELKETARPIGIVTLVLRDAYDYPDIGFAMLPEYEGHGYAFEASKTYLDALLSNDCYENIIAITLPHNQKAIRLLTKLGLSFMKDIQTDKEALSMYSLL